MALQGISKDLWKDLVVQAMENTQLATGEIYTEYARKEFLDKITRKTSRAMMVRCKQKWTTKKDNEQRKGYVQVEVKSWLRTEFSPQCRFQ